MLASLPSLEHGFARELLLQWAGQPANTVIFTQAAPQGTLAATLVERARSDMAAGRPAAGLPGAAAGPGRPGVAPGLGSGPGPGPAPPGGKPLVLELDVARRVPLEGRARGPGACFIHACSVPAHACLPALPSH